MGEKALESPLRIEKPKRRRTKNPDVKKKKRLKRA